MGDSEYFTWYIATVGSAIDNYLARFSRFKMYTADPGILYVRCCTLNVPEN